MLHMLQLVMGSAGYYIYANRKMPMTSCTGKMITRVFIHTYIHACHVHLYCHIMSCFYCSMYMALQIEISTKEWFLPLSHNMEKLRWYFPPMEAVSDVHQPL